MKKIFTSSVTAVAFLFSHTLHADAAGDPVEEAVPVVEETIIALEPTPELPPPPTDKEVGKASADAANAAKWKNWQSIALAAGAVTVATVALILVANHQGHDSD